MSSDDDSEWARKKKFRVSGEDMPKRRYRTVIDGVKNLNLKRPQDIWRNKRLSNFIDSNTSEGKRIAYNKKLDYLKIKNEKEYHQRKERDESTILESPRMHDSIMSLDMEIMQ